MEDLLWTPLKAHLPRNPEPHLWWPTQPCGGLKEVQRKALWGSDCTQSFLQGLCTSKGFCVFLYQDSASPASA